jgi:hypothetical protein
MKRVVLLMGGLLATSLFAQAGGLYRWVDKAGKVHYGDTPPREAALVEEKKLADDVAPGAAMPYETRRAQQGFPVTLYVADNCGELCVQARELLVARGIPFTEKNLVTQEEIDAFRRASGGDGAPALAVGRTFVNGFEAGRWHGELDNAGYPKSSLYRPAPAPSAPAAANPPAP